MKLTYEDFTDPFKILFSVRTVIRWTFLRGVLDCQYCLSFWTTQVMAHLVLQELSLLSFSAGLGAYGVVFLLVRAEEILEEAVYGGDNQISSDTEELTYDQLELIDHGDGTMTAAPGRTLLTPGGVEIDLD